MREPAIDREFGRTGFGASPASYHAARPKYPEWVFETLRERCGLLPGAATFEIGAGTGTATSRLVALGAKPLIAIEPDPRLATFLRESIRDEALSVICAPLEDAALKVAGFDLGVSATAFHWLDEDLALAKSARCLKPGGWLAVFWNVFGDDSRPDAFHEVTKDLLKGPTSPSAGANGIPFALDETARLAALERSQAFENLEHLSAEWPLLLDADQVVALYATYSNISVRQDRDDILTELGRIARDEFRGKVTRNMTTSLYVARRRLSG